MTDKNSFEIKFNEIRNSIRFHNETEFKEQLNRKLTDFVRMMKDARIPYWERELHAKELATELSSFRSNISSFVPEFMLATLVQESGLGISFIPTSTEAKTCDLLIKKSYKTEVKTFLDTSKEGRKIEINLAEELSVTLKREKTVEDINDSLSKGAEIVFMFLTFSSLSVGFAKYTFQKNISFRLSEALKQSIALAEENRTETENTSSCNCNLDRYG